MQKEIEAKFLSTDHAAMRAKLYGLGATCTHPMRVMRRAILDYPDRRLQSGRDAFVRVRDEGDKITLTYKASIERQFGGATEIELTVDNYAKAIALLEALGLVVNAEQETRRETWHFGAAEIVLDEWPWLDPFIEIEAASKAVVRRTAARLGLDWANAVFGTITTAYRAQYPDITADEHISHIPVIAFNLPRPVWFVKGKDAA